jgi:hypothetical protein
MAGPFTFPVAAAVPFDGTETTSGIPVSPPFVSTNVRDAIIEAVTKAGEESRSLLLSQYNGNANVGRYLEFFVGISSFDAPLYADAGFDVYAITAATTGTSSNAEIGFFDLNVSTTIPLYTLNMSGLKRKIESGNPIFSISSSGEFAIRITNNSIQKPHLQLVIG